MSLPCAYNFQTQISNLANVVGRRTYPTPIVKYQLGYSIPGTIPTTLAGQETCLVDAYVTWPPNMASSLTQIPATLPPGGDEFGIFWTTHGGAYAWPAGFLDARSLDQAAFQMCKSGTYIEISPASALTSVLVLTTTSVSTKKKGSTTTEAADTTTAQPTQTIAIGGNC